MSKRILLIDDDAYFQDFYGNALRKAGFTVDAAANGEEALKILKENEYDLFIVDLVMPLMGGTAFLKAIRRRKTPRIVLTGLGGETDKEDARKAGAVRFLEKAQTTPAELVAEVQGVLGA